jgi:predicted glycogen debranching enzyme
MIAPPAAEWLETDGLGGFASGTVGGPRTRRYHALLLVATRPPGGRMVLVNGLDASVDMTAGEGDDVGANARGSPDARVGAPVYLSRQHYAPDVIAPAAGAELEAFSRDPWPTWTWRVAPGVRVSQEVLVPGGIPAVILRWRLLDRRPHARLTVRPFLSGRDFHSLHHENPAFDFSGAIDGDRVRWTPYAGVPAITALSNGAYGPEPAWYGGFLYAEERARGLDYIEDLASPGTFTWDLAASDAVLVLTSDPGATAPAAEPALAAYRRWAGAERRRRAKFVSPLHRAAAAYLVTRGAGKTIIAGYPWFGDWGRDTLISLRGLCLATGRLADARAILLEWADQVSEGMLPNRFVDQGDAPEFNTVDAALWYVVAVHDYLSAAPPSGRTAPTRRDRDRLAAACLAIVSGYARGTRYGIRLDDDGLLAAGEPGVQLTWMDAKVGDWVVTPRSGKPVEIEALWLNALKIVSTWDPSWSKPAERGLRTFGARFWNPALGWLNDVVDTDHRPGTFDGSLRPNQIFAVGGLPFPVLAGKQARRVVDIVQSALWTPLGLRSLAPDDPRYAPRYEGGVRERDGAYHQGTVWPWLIGPFADAWLRVHGDTPDARRRARRCFLDPILAHLDEAGLGHVSEIADGDPPHTPRGCPFQAWSVAEALRLDQLVLRRSAGETA